MIRRENAPTIPEAVLPRPQIPDSQLNARLQKNATQAWLSLRRAWHRSAVLTLARQSDPWQRERGSQARAHSSFLDKPSIFHPFHGPYTDARRE